jgi:hypothetical protein
MRHSNAEWLFARILLRSDVPGNKIQGSKWFGDMNQNIRFCTTVGGSERRTRGAQEAILARVRYAKNHLFPDNPNQDALGPSLRQSTLMGQCCSK